MTMRTTERVGKMVAIMEVVETDDLMIITDRGVLIRQPVSSIRTIGRVTQGVKLIRLDEKDKISNITRVVHYEETAPEDEENETTPEEERQKSAPEEKKE